MAAGNLVDYSSSSSCDSAEEDAPSNKRMRTDSVTACVHHVTTTPAVKESLPLPDSILNMFQEDEEPPCNHGDHGGRVRSFPHVRGNWPTFVHIPFSLGDHDLLQCVTSYHQALCTLLPQWVPFGELHMLEDVHISLSRTLPIRHHWIEPLVGSLKNHITGHKKGVMGSTLVVMVA